MSAARIVFTLPEGCVRFDEAGDFLGVHPHLAADSHARTDTHTDGAGYLAPGLAPERLIIDGADDDWARAGCVADIDEIEITYRSRGFPQLSAVLRHSVSVVWGTRLMLSNTGPDSITIDRVSLGLRPGPDFHGWALAAGATAAYTLMPDNGVGPLLGWSLQHGEISSIDASGLHCDQVSIAAGGRYVVQFLWSFHDEPAQLHRSRSHLVPEQTCLTAGEPIEVADEDTALVALGTVEITTTEGIRELTSELPGHYPIELRSGRGTTRFEMQWVPPLGQVLAAAADRLLEGPQTPAGVPKLGAAHQAILVQQALAEMLIMDPELGSDALELYSSQLLEASDLDPLDIVYLCGEWTRTGDADLLDKAVDETLRTAAVRPGLGLAATRLCVALLMAARPVDDILAGLAGLRPAKALEVTSLLAELELILVLQSNIEQPGEELLARIQRLGACLGYGLPGQPVEPMQLDTLGYLITVFGLLPDRAGDAFRQTWGTTPQALAERYRPTVLSASTEAGDRGLAWLVLGRLPG